MTNNQFARWVATRYPGARGEEGAGFAGAARDLGIAAATARSYAAGVSSKGRGKAVPLAVALACQALDDGWAAYGRKRRSARPSAPKPRHSTKALDIADSDVNAAMSRAGSMTAAAGQLGVSVAWLSRRWARLRSGDRA